MNFVTFFLLILCERTFVSAQSDTIIFAGSTPMPTTTSTTTTRSAQQCVCVISGTCSTGNTGIDIRIVNTGVNCSAGYTYCCSPNQGNIIDASCGTRKIVLTERPQGQASFGEYPWQAALLTTSNAYIGSGVLISPNFVLTVAHKVAPYLNGGFKVRLGEWDAQAVTEPYPYQEYGVAKVASHPSFNAANLQNDVALIKLSSTVAVTSFPNINTACLPTGATAEGTRCWVSGWGKDAFGPTGSYQSIMKEVDVPVISQANCQNRLRGTRLGQFFILDTNSFLCAGGETGKDACTGDGGSPLVCQTSTGQWQVIGMVAWGIGCADTGVPGVYVNVFNFLPWINQQMMTM